MSVFRTSSSEVSISILLRKCHTLSTCSVRPRSSLSSWPLSTRRSLSITTYLNDQNSGKRETSSNCRQGFGGRSDNFNFLAASEPFIRADSGSVFVSIMNAVTVARVRCGGVSKQTTDQILLRHHLDFRSVPASTLKAEIVQ